MLSQARKNALNFWIPHSTLRLRPPLKKCINYCLQMLLAKQQLNQNLRIGSWGRGGGGNTVYFKIVVVETRKRGTGAHSRTRALAPLASLTTWNEGHTRTLLVNNSIDCEQLRGVHFFRLILFFMQPTHYSYDYIVCVKMMRRVILFLVREAVLK